MSIKDSIIFFFIIFFLFSCKRQLFNQKAKVNNNENLAISEINFKYLSGKAKINYVDNDTDVSAALNIRIKKDSIIWLSVTAALGIEASRCLISKDSLFMLDRINNNYYAYDYKDISEKIQININYGIIESILLGNLLYPYSKGDSVTRLSNGNTFILTQTQPDIKVENAIGSGNLKLEEIHITQKNSQQNLQVYYKDFRNLDEFLFAFNNLIKINTINNMVNKALAISIEYNKVELSEKSLSFPFNVPSKFIKK